MPSEPRRRRLAPALLAIFVLVAVVWPGARIAVLLGPELLGWERKVAWAPDHDCLLIGSGAAFQPSPIYAQVDGRSLLRFDGEIDFVPGEDLELDLSSHDDGVNLLEFPCSCNGQ